MKTKALFTLVGLALFSVAAAQNTHYGESFELNSPLNANQSHEYHANSYIDLNLGFRSEPKNHNYSLFQLGLDGIYPPEAGLTGGPNSADTGVVGAIGGTVDVGPMGAAVYSIPIEVPQGINGMQPHLAITYNSQAGNGLLGWGWDITGLSSVERTGSTRYHDGVTSAVTMNDDTDRYLLDGVRLIVMAEYTDSVEYKAEQDDMSKIMAYFRTDYFGGGLFGYGTIKILEHFKVWKSDGRLLEYGNTLDSRPNSQTTEQLALCWLLSRESDRNGNSVIYHYDIHPETGEYYISSIDYTKHSENGETVVEPEFTVGFHYRAGYRQDYDFQYVAGNIVQQRKLLDHISVTRNNFDTEMERYSFEYRIDTVGYFYESVNMHNRLERILFQKDGTALNPTTILWSANHCSAPLFTQSITDTAIYNNYPFVGDFNGDGYSDLAVAPHMDSVYTHNVDVNFFLNDPANPGHFSHNTSLTLHDIDRRLDWIYPIDLNDDGLDDLVACFYDSVAAIGRDTMAVRIYENLEGSHFVLRDSLTLGGGRFLVRQGDFLGRGSLQLLLMPVVTTPIQSPIAFSLLVRFDGDSLLKEPAQSLFFGVRDIATGDFDGNGSTDVLVVTDSCSTVYSLGLSGPYLSYNEQFNTDEINHQGSWKHVFTGDFNSDGKTDMLYVDNHQATSSRWRIFYSTGMALSTTGSIPIYYELPSHNIYPNSLRKVYDGINHMNNLVGYSHGVCLADFDGDGVTDIAVTRMSASTSSISVYCHYLPSAHKFQSQYYGSNNVNCKSQYFHIGNFLGKDNVSFLGLEYKDNHWIGGNSRPAIFSLKPASELNSVSIVVDGMDNPVGFGYGYVQQAYQDYGYGVRGIPTPIRVLSSITTYNASDKQMRENLSYSDPCHHRDGHGWIGFRKTTKKYFENSIEVERTVSTRSLETMASHALLLPEADTSYALPNGTPVLSSLTDYQFAKVLSSYGNLNPNHLVACPALTGKTIVQYDPDNPGDILSRAFVENYYNYNNGYYSRTYHCDSTRTGVGNALSSTFGTCEFRTVESTSFYGNDYASWTINKPHIVTSSQSRTGKPDVRKDRWLEYISTDSYLPSRIFDVPNGSTSQNPLMLMTDFAYYPNGNLMSKTVRVPHGQLGEQQKTVKYEYGPDTQQRLVTKETVASGSLSYETSYSYDSHDRIDTLTAANGLATIFENDAFGVTSWTSNADGTQSCTALRWSEGHPLEPKGALYYSWQRSSDGKQSLTFFHKTGAELRTVGYGLHGEPVIVDKRYDERGRLAAVTDPYMEGEPPLWTAYEYDNLNRLFTTTTPDTTVTTITYDGFLTETTVTSPQGLSQESAVTVNAMGWTVRSDDASGAYVMYDHYADGLMATATVNGDATTTVTATYDDARRRSTLSDPDYGTLTTVYDAYGRLKKSITPRELAEQTETVNHYDGFDRLVTTTDGLENTRTDYGYNETGVLKGSLDEVRFKVQGGTDIQHISYSYDTLARPIRISEQRATGSYSTKIEYDGQSRVGSIIHPTDFIVRYGYHHGYLMSVTDDQGNLLWKTKDMDAQGRLLEAELGNGAVTRHTYDTVMHRLKSIVTTKNLQNLTYSYDNFGNLAARKDWKTNMEENFTYDDMNRLTGITLKRPSGQDLHCAVTYDALGRMTSKQAVTTVNGTPQVTTTFSLPAFDATKVHAMAQAQTSNGVFPASTQSITYTGFDKVRTLKQGNDSIRFTYGFDRQRIRMEETVGGKIRTKDYVGSCEFVTESDSLGAVSRSLAFISGPYGTFAVAENSDSVEMLHFILKDNLGSWVTITDANGTVEQQMSFDAWGNRRNPITWVNYTPDDVFGKPLFDRGFTGHEHLTAFGLVNMNGRMYDPVTSSFLSPDRYVQDPSSAQGFNRYAYCMYNPLRLTDPSGWLAGGGGHGPGIPPYVVIEGWASGYLLNEVTIIDDNLSLSNTKEKIPFKTYYYGGNRLTAPWSDDYNGGPSINPGGSTSGGSTSGGGSHGGSPSNTAQNPNVNVKISSNIDLSPVNVSCFYINSGNTIIGKAAEWTSAISAGSKEASVFEKIATHSTILGIVGVGINIGCTTYQIYYGEIPKHEGLVRMGMTGVEFGLSFVPYVGPLLSIGLTAYDIGGGFDDNLYKTENWWKEKQP